MRCLSNGIVPILCLVPFALSAVAADVQTELWQPYAEAMGRIGTVRSIGQADLFAPIRQDESSLTFVNLRGRLDDHEDYEVNLGLGYRKMFERWIVGGWTYFDSRLTTHNNRFLQANAGIELLSESFDFRSNAYIPERGAAVVSAYTTATRSTSIDASISLSNEQLSVIRRENITLSTTRVETRESALPGFDFEVGYPLPLPFEARLYVGGYRFAGDSEFSSISGPRSRLEIRVNDLPLLARGSRLMLGVEISHDSVRQTQTFGLLQLRIPLPGSAPPSLSLSPLQRRMTEPVVRDVDVAASTGTRSSSILSHSSSQTILQALDPDTGTAVQRAVIIQPGMDISQKVAAAGANSLVVVDGSGGQYSVTSSVLLETGQTILGGGQHVSLQYDDPVLGRRSVTWAVGGSRPTLVGTDPTLRVIHAGNYSRIQGINIDGGAEGVYVTGTNVTLSNVSIANSLSEGLDVAAGGTALASSISVSHAGNYGIYVGGALDLFQADVSFSGWGGLGGFPASRLHIENSRFHDNSSAGMYLGGSDLLVENTSVENTFTGAMSDGVGVYVGASGTINGLRVKTTDGDGLAITNSAISINNSSLSDIGHHPFFAADAVNVSGTVLHGSGNTVEGFVRDLICRDNGSNSGNISFSDIQGTGPGHCP